MKITEVYNSKAIAHSAEEVASNKQAYLGTGLFPSKKKMGLDLKWIKTSKGLPISLAPSNFDAVSTIRSREGFTVLDTEMAFFRESMLLKEADRQDILRVQESSDPYAREVLEKVYDDAQTLVEGADVVPERMRMSLLNPTSGHPSISIVANGVTYAYNYDPNSTYSTNNYAELSGTSKWSDTTNSDPLSDIQTGIDAVEAKTGVTPEIMIVSKQTMTYLRNNANIKSAILAQNPNASIVLNDKIVKALIKDVLGVDVIVYSKKYKDEDGTTANFFADGYATLIPSGVLGNTWYGCTPEEADLVSGAQVDTTLVNGTVAVTVVTTNDPVNVKTTVSEIVLPSFERMDETYAIKCY